MNKSINQFIKFCIVGFFGALLNYSTFFILYNYLSVYYIISSGTGFILSVFLAFYLNKKYTFNIVTKSKNKLVKYFSVNIFSLILGLLSLAFFVEILFINIYIANLLIIGIQTTSNFLGSKLFVFR
ncbi:MAG: GtrA family protein [Nanoarchaeota archaeon]